MFVRRAALTIVPFALTLTLAACGSDKASNSSDATVAETGAATDSTPADRIPADAAFNAADVAFTQGMIPHHQQAVEMATIALNPAGQAGPAVTDLAKRIQVAQDPEIKLMSGWLAAWGQPIMAGMAAGETMAPGETMPPSTDMEDMEGMEGMEGMMTADQMKGLSSVTGAAFDKMWTEMMISHHSGAVTSSKAIQSDGKSAEVIELAGKIITAQEAEIAEMKKLLVG